MKVWYIPVGVASVYTGLFLLDLARIKSSVLFLGLAGVCILVIPAGIVGLYRLNVKRPFNTR